jgi:hypothetical protein
VAYPYGTVYGPTAYPEVRYILAPSLAAHLSDSDIERLVERQLGIEAVDAEDFLGTLGNIWNAAAPVVARVAPGAIQGAISGGMAAGPYGALAGAGMGILSGLLGGGGQPSPGAGPPPMTAPPPMAAPPPMSAPPMPMGAGGSPAAASLAQMLMRPEIQQALMAMLMGSAGRQQIPVAGTQVPVGAFTNAIGQLSQQASAEHHVRVGGFSAAVPEYLFESNGALAVANPSNAAERATRVVSLLDKAEVQRVSRMPSPPATEAYRGIDEAWSAEAYKGLDEAIDEALDGEAYHSLEDAYKGLEDAYKGLDEAVDEDVEDVESVLSPIWSMA